jgi:hypothetical protein
MKYVPDVINNRDFITDRVIMNKFIVLSCVDMKQDKDLEYNGHVVILAYSSDPSFMLFFPIPKESAKILDYVLQENSDYDINTKTLGLYKTMIDSWRTTDRYLSGIILDSVYDEKADDDILTVNLALSDSDGNLDSLVNINFVNAMIVAAMKKANVIVSEKLLVKLVPTDEEEMEGQDRVEDHPFPEDKKILNIVKEIMSGKIKGNEENEENEENENRDQSK